MASNKNTVDEEVIIQPASNTIDIGSGESSISKILPPDQSSSLLPGGSVTEIAEEITIREYVLTNFNWSTKHSVNNSLVHLDLPFSLYKSLGVQPNGNVFRSFSAAQFNIRLRVLANATRFMTGQLLICWRYLDSSEFGNVGNVYVCSQRPHAILSASSSNDVIITIPYKFVNPYVCMPTTSRSSCSSFAALDIIVLVPLQTTAGSYNSLNVTIKASILNFKGYGIIPAPYIDLAAEHQMWSGVLAQTAEQLLRSMNPDLNRDNPTDIIPPITFVPQSTHSWSIGTGISERINVLRLDAASVTPHPDGYPENEMTIQHVTRTYGLCDRFQWDFRNPIGYDLFVYEVNPLLIGSTMLSPKTKTESAVYSITPLQVISSCFDHYNGSIEICVDFVNTFMHNGRVMMAFLPGIDKKRYKENVDSYFGTGRFDDINICSGGYHVFFSIGAEATQFTFKVPYIHPRPWFRMGNYDLKNKFTVSNSIGLVVLKVVNPLIPTETIPSSIYVNVYVRAGDDFSLSVPVSPKVGLAMNKTYIPPNTSIAVKKGYFPCYAGNWRYWTYGKVQYYIMRYGNTTDHVAQMEGPHIRYNAVYVARVPTAAVSMKKPDNSIISAKYFVCPNRPSDSSFVGYYYFVPYETLNDAISAAKSKITPIGGIPYASDSAIVWSNNDVFDLEKIYELPSRPDPYCQIHSSYPFEIVEHQALEEGDNVVQPGVSTNVTSVSFYNENFNDLKTLLRRYSYYGHIQVELKTTMTFGQTFCIIPVHPMGLELSFVPGGVVDNARNYNREGLIPIITSGYRFFKGGLRFKIIFESPDLKNELFEITHFPNFTFDQRLPVVLPPGGAHNFYSGTGHAFYCQSARMNEFFEIEVPYYIPNDYGSVERLNPKSYSENVTSANGMGGIGIATMFTPIKDTKLNIRVYYSFADDMRLSSFQGFPPMIKCSEIPFSELDEEIEQQEDDVEHQMDCVESSLSMMAEKAFAYYLKKFLTPRSPPKYDAKKFANIVREEMPELSVCTAEQVGELLFTRIKDAYENEQKEGAKTLIEPIVEQISEQAKKIADNIGTSIKEDIKEAATDVKEMIKETVQETTENVSKAIDDTSKSIFERLMEFLNVMRTSMTDLLKTGAVHLIHFASNPTLRTAITSIVGFCIQVGLIPVNFIGKVTEAFFKCYDYLKSFFLKTEPGDDESQAAPIDELTDGAGVEHQMSSDVFCALSATCLTAVASAAGVSGSLLGAPNFFKDMTNGIKNMAITANSLTVLFKNNLECFQKLIQWLINKFRPDFKLIGDLIDSSADIGVWVREAATFVDPVNKNYIKSKPAAQVKLFRLNTQARILYVKERKCIQQNHELRSLCTSLMKLTEECVSECLCPSARFEPFVLELVGATNVGKSFLLQSVGVKCLKDMGYRTFSEPIFTRSPGVKFFNKVQQQPIILYDDFLQIDQGESALEAVSELFALKSTAVFNPNIAELENKKLLYNPLMVLLAANDAFPKIIGVSCADALYRRRDQLWKMKIKPEFADSKGNLKCKISELPDDVKRTFGHVNFYCYPNPVDDVEYHIPYSYEEFMTKVSNDFREYYLNEIKNYKARLESLTALAPDDDDDSFSTVSKRLKDFEERLLGISDQEPTKIVYKNLQGFCDPTFGAVIGERPDLIDQDLKFINEMRSVIPNAPPSNPIAHQMKIEEMKIIYLLIPTDIKEMIILRIEKEIGRSRDEWTFDNVGVFEEAWNACMDKYRQNIERLFSTKAIFVDEQTSSDVELKLVAECGFYEKLTEEQFKEIFNITKPVIKESQKFSSLTIPDPSIYSEWLIKTQIENQDHVKDKLNATITEWINSSFGLIAAIEKVSYLYPELRYHFRVPFIYHVFRQAEIVGFVINRTSHKMFNYTSMNNYFGTEFTLEDFMIMRLTRPNLDGDYDLPEKFDRVVLNNYNKCFDQFQDFLTPDELDIGGIYHEHFNNPNPRSQKIIVKILEPGISKMKLLEYITIELSNEYIEEAAVKEVKKIVETKLSSMAGTWAEFTGQKKDDKQDSNNISVSQSKFLKKKEEVDVVELKPGPSKEQPYIVEEPIEILEEVKDGTIINEIDRMKAPLVIEDLANDVLPRNADNRICNSFISALNRSVHYCYVESLPTMFERVKERTKLLCKILRDSYDKQIWRDFDYTLRQDPLFPRYLAECLKPDEPEVEEELEDFTMELRHDDKFTNSAIKEISNEFECECKHSFLNCDFNWDFERQVFVQKTSVTKIDLNTNKNVTVREVIPKDFCGENCLARFSKWSFAVGCHFIYNNQYYDLQLDPTLLVDQKQKFPSYFQPSIDFLLGGVIEKKKKKVILQVSKVHLEKIIPEEQTKSSFLDKYIKDPLIKVWKLIRDAIDWLTPVVGIILAASTAFNVGRKGWNIACQAVGRRDMQWNISQSKAENLAFPLNYLVSHDNEGGMISGMVKGAISNSGLTGRIGVKLYERYVEGGRKPNFQSKTEDLGKSQIKQRVKLANKQKLNVHKFARPEMLSESTPVNQDHQDNIVRLIGRNHGEISFFNGETFVNNKQIILGICGNYLITTKHFIEAANHVFAHDKELRLKLRRGKAEWIRNYRDCEFMITDESSIAILKYPGVLFKDIRSHFAKEDEHYNLTVDGLFVTYLEDKVREQVVRFKRYDGLAINSKPPITEQYLSTAYEYPVQGLGLCGSVLLSTKGSPKIIGIHVAGSSKTGRGYSQLIVREDYEGLTGVYPIAEIEVDPQMEECKPLLMIESNVEVLGTIPRNLAVHVPQSTKIKASKMFDEIYPHQSEPAPLSSKDIRLEPGRSPLKEGLEKHGIPPLPFNHEILDRCYEYLSEKIRHTARPVLANARELLTDSQIFCGVSSTPYYKHLELTTSEGYPLVKDRPSMYSSKKWLFEYEEQTDEGGRKLLNIHPKLKEIMSHNHKLRQEGIIPPTIFVDCLKDHRIPIEKIQKPGCTRIFSVAPIEYTWTCKKYFGHFQAAYSEGRFETGTAVGINTRSLEWTRLYRFLTKKGSKVVTGDYKSFGDRLYWYAIEKAFQIIIDWYEEYYSDKFSDYRKVLMYEGVYCQRMVANLIYRQLCGIPSGFPLTVEINDLVNQLYMMYCWTITTEQPLNEYDRDVARVFYGDDLIMCVNDRAIQKFNFKTIQAVLKDLNIEFTPASKSDKAEPYEDLSKATFLKCEFVPHPTRKSVVMAKLPISSCLESLNWRWESNDPIDSTYESVRASLQDLHGHGPLIYDQWRKKILKWYRDHADEGFEFVHTKSWNEIDREMYSDAV